MGRWGGRGGWDDGENGFEHTQMHLVAQAVKSLPAMQVTWTPSLGQEDPWGRTWQPPPAFFGFPGGARGKEPACPPAQEM